MRIELLATEVRVEIGLNGPIDPKVLAVWLGLELHPVLYPTATGLVGTGESWIMALEYDWNMAPYLCNQQIAEACAEYVLFSEDMLCPARSQIKFLAALLCDPDSLVLIPT